MNNLLRFSHETFCISDYETENLNVCQNNRPWNLGFILFNDKEILEKHSYYIWWKDLNISQGAAEATRFNYDEYKKKARPQKEIWDIWEKYLYNKGLIHAQHNGIMFDSYITQIWRSENNLNKDYSFLNSYIDTNSLAKGWKLGLKSIERKDWLTSWYKYGNFKQKGLKTNLTTLGKEFNINFSYDNLHQAENDCLLNRLVFQQLITKIDI